MPRGEVFGLVESPFRWYHTVDLVVCPGSGFFDKAGQNPLGMVARPTFSRPRPLASTPLAVSGRRSRVGGQEVSISEVRGREER